MGSMIDIQKLTKDYGYNRGVFDIDLKIEKGEMVGFAGTNGSGKTTTIRNIMGFIKPTSGKVFVKGLEAWTHSSEIVKDIGYVPGEVAFPDLATGTDFLKSQAQFLNVKNMDYANYLVDKLQLDIRAPLKRMSKGMKQKTAIVSALMADPEIIILDEPTTGLDPLMRDSFLEIIKNEHKKGKTIFMSSHMFEELEQTCNRVALIQNGHIGNIASMDEIKSRPCKQFKIEFNNKQDYLKFKNLPLKIIRDQEEYNQVTVEFEKSKQSEIFKLLKDYNIKFISEIEYTLEKYFKEVLKAEKEERQNVQ